MKVAIIGGGPSGWSAAEALRDERWAGRFDVTVYEKNDYFGGKCRTVFADGRTCNGERGGYELGAGVVSKGSWSNVDLEALLVRHQIPYSDAAEPDRTKYRFFAGGRKVDVGFLLGTSLRNPLAFIRAVYGICKYWWHLRRYSSVPQVEYQGRPDALNKTLSEVFPREFNLCGGFGMQGFGYAHLPDAQLTPAMLYYHQYARKDVIVNPVFTIDVGMQGIWAKVASTYSEGSARLNEEVLAVRRDRSGVEVETSEGVERYDYLVVAVPLGPSLSFLDLNEGTTRLLSKVHVNHYVTVLCRVDGLVDIASVNVLKTVDRRQVGGVVFAYKRYADSDWISLNLYVDPEAPKTDEEIIDAVALDLREEFGARLVEASSARIYHWHDYFPHLDTAALDAGWYQEFEDKVQGRRRTLYVSSGLHMETVGASVQYATAKVRDVAQRWFDDSEL